MQWHSCYISNRFSRAFRVFFACFLRVFCLANAYIRSQSLLILVEDISWRLNFVAQIAGKSTQL
jgi:hypothetical protein